MHRETLRWRWHGRPNRRLGRRACDGAKWAGSEYALCWVRLRGPARGAGRRNAGDAQRYRAFRPASRPEWWWNEPTAWWSVPND